MNSYKFAATLLTLSALSITARAATITGKVVDTSSRPVDAAIVTLSEAAVTRGIAPAFHGASTKTAADGTFSFDSLEAGTYLLCSQVPEARSSTHASGPKPCRW